MKLTTIMALILVAGTAACNGPTAPAAGRTVTVCMEDDAAFGVTREAQLLASRMFAEIGVTIHWRRGLKPCPEQGIMVSLNHKTPKTLMPGALAYARPYEGAHIRVFYDRITATCQPASVGRVLAHVLVHEITHILQGINRHSETGIMKAQWDGDDFTNIRWKRLEFEPIDIDLINVGLEGRAARAMVAMNAPGRLRRIKMGPNIKEHSGKIP